MLCAARHRCETIRSLVTGWYWYRHTCPPARVGVLLGELAAVDPAAVEVVLHVPRILHSVQGRVQLDEYRVGTKAGAGAVPQVDVQHVDDALEEVQALLTVHGRDEGLILDRLVGVHSLEAEGDLTGWRLRRDVAAGVVARLALGRPTGPTGVGTRGLGTLGLRVVVAAALALVVAAVRIALVALRHVFAASFTKVATASFVN